ncbi:uncharacterized protein LTR77_010349 [Saxophila tyrrhenica]|uniref:Arrestin C-terminal-like domain-containing protein n=1 Tax=Saxophila tyrrhenica TaxID=1690608 RepID=A0AAV9NVS8_9PEZI|nr:hypothetical protein LTR77_010349 [Saxophila tyrrhenica]
MVPTPRTNGYSSRVKPTLEIIPSSRFIVFNGSEHEATPVKLEGVVRLTTPEPTSILKPKVRLEGKRKISWYYMGGIGAGEVTDKRTFWSQEQRLGNLESSHKVKAGTIEWPFEFELSPTMPESVEGLRETYIAYHLSASVSRPGWNAKDIVAQEHIRIVRTLGQDSMEMTRSRVNADIWANKIAYSISIPTDAIVFGTSITADVELSPIKKGLVLGKVELRLLETVVKRIQASEVPGDRDRSKSDETEVAKTDLEFPEQSRVMYDDETVDNPTMADEMYKFKVTLPLPRSLNTCRQDVDSHQINVTHRFKLMVNIHNPEGHISQLVCRLPVKLFISPNLPVDESNNVCAVVNGMSDEVLNNTETTVTAPPEYGRHQLDQLFSDMDPINLASRAPSMPGSPSGLGAQSRRGSQDGMPSLNGVANELAESLPNGNSVDEHGSASPSILHSRLADLQQRGISVAGRSNNNSPSGGNSPTPGMNDLPDIPRSIPSSLPTSSYINTSASRHSPQTSAPISRRVSNEETNPTNNNNNNTTTDVTQSDYDMASLARVPSYGAALRMPSGALTPFTDGPPTYVEATSRPASPGIQRPGLAHVRHGGDTPRSASSSGTSTGASLGAGGMPAPAHHRTASRAAEDDARARLRMLRART